MIRWSWKVNIGLVLVCFSLVLSIVHYFVFHDAATLSFYLALDIVFVPVQVLLVTLIIERLLNEREKQALIKKLNMVVGAFFSEVGTTFIRMLAGACVDAVELAQRLDIQGRWKAKDYAEARRFADKYECSLTLPPELFLSLRVFLLEKRSFVLALLQNPSLLEHERFTDLLWAICHLTEELDARSDFTSLPASDLQHLSGDVRRAYALLVREWLRYVEHLQENYPYMYSLSVRLNPFKPDARVVVEG
ncbi:MAG TPA: hypothetical protein DCZ69_04805 [Syntrophobacteraceae bacterium]|nr:hypothetical protein [Syntrophobacteraceae bacterium]HBD07559.1 hypothetical protein [Syntrophobacteraceae bacterium]HBZ54408.1 hypothetical protein [Syntrophobacteraceae bacterium]